MRSGLTFEPEFWSASGPNAKRRRFHVTSAFGCFAKSDVRAVSFLAHDPERTPGGRAIWIRGLTSALEIDFVPVSVRYKMRLDIVTAWASTAMDQAGLTFVLVHGAWHGGWCWKKVVPLLQAAGHRVVALTLTGLGERAHLINPTIGLKTHVNDVLGTLEMDDLTNVILVGHSYGGLVISSVAAHASGRIRRLVYLDALVPENGQSGFDLNSQQFRQRLEAAAVEHGEGYKVSPNLDMLGVTDAADLEWLRARLRPQPIASFSQPAEAPPATAQILSTYILCTQFGFQDTAARCRAKGWPVLEIDCGHDAMVIKPRELVDLLLTPDCH